MSNNGVDRYAYKYGVVWCDVWYAKHKVSSVQLDSTSEGEEPSVDSLFFFMPNTVLSKVFILEGCFFNIDASEITILDR